MFDWHLQTLHEGQPLGRPTAYTSAEDAIQAANEALASSGVSEVAVYHRLYSNQASLSLRSPMPVEEISQKAGHLERQAQKASRDG